MRFRFNKIQNKIIKLGKFYKKLLIRIKNSKTNKLLKNRNKLKNY